MTNQINESTSTCHCSEGDGKPERAHSTHAQRLEVAGPVLPEDGDEDQESSAGEGCRANWPVVFGYHSTVPLHACEKRNGHHTDDHTAE